MQWTQIYDPLGRWWISTLVAALPIVVLFGLLAGLKVKPHWCAIAGASTAVAVAILFFQMPPLLAALSFGYGVAFGVLKIAWIVQLPRHGSPLHDLLQLAVQLMDLGVSREPSGRAPGAGFPFDLGPYAHGRVRW